jgi:uncharacterized oxidoreductase
MTDLWLRAGSGETEARLTADHLVGANLAGHDSHGIGMAPRYVKSFKAGELRLNQRVSIALDNGPLITVDAGHGMGSRSRTRRWRSRSRGSASTASA